MVNLLSHLSKFFTLRSFITPDRLSLYLKSYKYLLVYLRYSMLHGISLYYFFTTALLADNYINKNSDDYYLPDNLKGKII